MTDTAVTHLDTSTADRPSRRRQRKWLVAAFALSAGLLFVWRYSHLGDPRFVGRWSVQGHGYGNASMELELARFGTGERRLSPPGQEPPVVEFTWRVEGEYLILDWPEDRPLLARIQMLVANFWRRSQGETEIGADKYHFEQDGSDRFRFRSSIGSQSIAFELTRIEEE